MGAAGSPHIPQSHVALGFSGICWAYIPLPGAIFLDNFVATIVLQNISSVQKIPQGNFTGENDLTGRRDRGLMQKNSK